MAERWEQWVAQWLDAGVIDAPTADRIRAFEAAQVRSGGWRWPIVLALSAGAVLVGAGVLLFVSAHWDTYSPTVRFAMVMATVALFHVAASLTTSRAPALSVALHAVGTVACGAGIFLAGQIFNMAEHWPSGVLLWALAAIAGAALLRQWPQMALTAVLVPVWLSTEWSVATQGDYRDAMRVTTAGLFLLALAYLGAPKDGVSSSQRRVLLWVGGITLLPLSVALAAAANVPSTFVGVQAAPISRGLTTTGWVVALGLPMAAAVVLRGADAWANALAALWVIGLLLLGASDVSIPLFAWWAVGAVALAAWGVREGRSERINLAFAIFAGTTVAFYFSQVMTKLGRSASLVGLGVLFLAGGFALERARRHLMQQVKGVSR